MTPRGRLRNSTNVINKEMILPIDRNFSGTLAKSGEVDRQRAFLERE
jgi:hypothetical protein